MSNTFSACFSPHWWQLTFISCLLFYLFMRSSLPPPLVTPLFSLVRWIRKDAETTGRLSIYNPAAILLPIHSSWWSFGLFVKKNLFSLPPPPPPDLTDYRIGSLFYVPVRTLDVVQPIGSALSLKHTYDESHIVLGSSFNVQLRRL